jgi:chromatin remodeling complex protein RSC6
MAKRPDTERINIITTDRVERGPSNGPVKVSAELAKIIGEIKP